MLSPNIIISGDISSDIDRTIWTLSLARFTRNPMVAAQAQASGSLKSPIWELWAVDPWCTYL